jgi:hypothetical protein
LQFKDVDGFQSFLLQFMLSLQVCSQR